MSGPCSDTIGSCWRLTEICCIRPPDGILLRTPALSPRTLADAALCVRPREASQRQNSFPHSLSTRSGESPQSRVGPYLNHSYGRHGGFGQLALHTFHISVCSSSTHTVIIMSLSVYPSLLTTTICRPSMAFPRTRYFHSRVARSRCRSMTSPLRIALSTSNTDNASSSISSRA